MARKIVKQEREKGPRPRVLWITRAQPAAAATAERVRRLGIEPVIEPLLEMRQFDEAVIDLTGASGLVFTSANAVAAFARRSPDRSLRVFAVGDATAAAARAQRFAAVLSAQGDVKALATALAARRRELTGVLCYFAAAEPAQDLAGALQAVGLSVRQTALYETLPRTPPDSVAERLPQIEAVLLHSAKAASLLAAWLKGHPAPHLRAFCLSRQVARPLSRSGLAAIASAAEPNEAALLALL